MKKLVAVIYVRASPKRKKRRTPSIAANDCCPTEKFGIRKGEIFFRKGDSTVRVQSEQELLNLLDQLESTADDDARHLEDAGSVFAIDEGLNRLLELGFERFSGRQTLRARILQAVQ